MVRRIASKRLTTCDVVDDGETVRLDFVDQAGCPVSLELPFGQAESLVMTLPRLLSKALAKRSGDDRCRYVFPLGRWAIESADARCLIVSLATPDGFEVAFAVPFAESRDLGKALKREGTAAARSDGVEAPWTKPKCRALN